MCQYIISSIDTPESHMVVRVLVNRTPAEQYHEIGRISGQGFEWIVLRGIPIA